jgi:Uncharacterized protein conserved in bacteria (DUF2237)
VLRDERGDGGRRPVPARNVLGEPLEMCSFKPMTGFYRDGYCNTGREDVGCHTVCAVMTAEFLAFSKSRGNDLYQPELDLTVCAWFERSGFVSGGSGCDHFLLRHRHGIQEGLHRGFAEAPASLMRPHLIGRRSRCSHGPVRPQ